MSVNKVILIGHLGQDPEIRYTSSGTAVANFSLATNESWTDKSGQRQERTEWHRVVVWSKLAEVCGQYLRKGRQAFVEGTLQTRSWEDQNGNKRYTTEIVARTVQFLGGQASADSSSGQEVSASGGQMSDSSSGPTTSMNPGGSGASNTNNNVLPNDGLSSDEIPF